MVECRSYYALKDWTRLDGTEQDWKRLNKTDLIGIGFFNTSFHDLRSFLSCGNSKSVSYFLRNSTSSKFKFWKKSIFHKLKKTSILRKYINSMISNVSRNYFRRWQVRMSRLFQHSAQQSKVLNCQLTFDNIDWI